MIFATQPSSCHLKGNYKNGYSFHAFIVDVIDKRTGDKIDRVIEVIIRQMCRHSSHRRGWHIIENIESETRTIKTSTLVLRKTPAGSYRDMSEVEEKRVTQLLSGKTQESKVEINGKQEIVDLECKPIFFIQDLRKGAFFDTGNTVSRPTVLLDMSEKKKYVIPSKRGFSSLTLTLKELIQVKEEKNAIHLEKATFGFYDPRKANYESFGLYNSRDIDYGSFEGKEISVDQKNKDQRVVLWNLLCIHKINFVVLTDNPRNADS